MDDTAWHAQGIAGVATEEEILNRLEKKLEALGVGYTRMELCVIELCRQIQSLVEHNSSLLQALADQEREEEDDSVGYLSAKPRKG